MVKQAEDLYRSESSYVEMAMTVTNPAWERTFEIKAANLPTAAFCASIKYQSFFTSFFFIKGVMIMGDKYKECASKSIYLDLK